jgi:hypothetical protein
MKDLAAAAKPEKIVEATGPKEVKLEGYFPCPFGEDEDKTESSSEEFIVDENP